MANIHVNTEVMRQLADRFIQDADTLRGSTLPALHNLTAQLEGDWQGISRQHYDQLLQNFQSSAMSLLNLSDDLGRHLHNTAQQFEQADQS